MNFLKLYVGDYQRDTGHLSIVEHGAYLLMLQHYYATERPLPTGRALHRLLRAESKADRDAIDSVVRQFWTERDGGLVNGRAAEELEKAAAAEGDAGVRREHERARQQRARERRAALYETLRARGVTPPFDATTAELVALVNGSVTHSVTPPVTQKITRTVTRDITAIQTPDTRLEKKRQGAAEDGGPGEGGPSPPLELVPKPPGMPRADRACRIPDGFPTPDQLAWAGTERPDLPLDTVAAMFRDHWLGKPGKDGRKLDWPATWRNWIRGQRAMPKPIPAAPAVVSSRWD